MNKTLISVLLILFAAVMIGIFPTDAEAGIYEDTVRLHILANSDSKEDQALKINVRDHILKEFGQRLSSSTSKKEAEKEITILLEEITRSAERKITDEGYKYSVKAELVKEWYDTREYEDFSLPCGYYTSLKIVIGEGEGKNWWCVMYPPLCTELASSEKNIDDAILNYTKEEIRLINGEGYRVKFKVLEVLSDAFRKK